MVRVATASNLETALNHEGGSVTALLEHLVGEPIDARICSQETFNSAASNELQVAEGQILLLRAAVLQGRRSGLCYVYAESDLVPSRLSKAFNARVTSTREPIGRILSEEGMAVTRHPLVRPIAGAQRAPPDIRTAIEDCLLHRRYRVDAEGTPVMAISEWFLASTKALFRQ